MISIRAFMKKNLFVNSLFYLAATAACISLVNGCKIIHSNETTAPDKTNVRASPVDTPITQTEIKSDEVSSLTLKTVYKDYFDESSKCHKTYNEFFGDKDGAYSSDSPCTLNLSFDRDGGAEKIIEIRRYDKTARQYNVVEKSRWTGKISAEQFSALAKIITDNAVFKDWQDVMLYVSNSRISITHPKGTRAAMSNVDQKTFVFLPMLESFKRLEKEIRWESSL